jgi:hypothetical protein
MMCINFRAPELCLLAGSVLNNKISGGKIISHRTPSGKNYIAKALRHAANSIGNQRDRFTPFFKQIIAFKRSDLFHRPKASGLIITEYDYQSRSLQKESK